jgi:hypothetical protein
MKQFFALVASFLVILILSSCGDPGRPVQKNVTGKPGEMIVIMSKDAWKDTSGSLIRHKLAQPYPSLPQDEPMFDLINVPPDAFRDLFKTTRNILQTSISSYFDSCGIQFQNDIYAYPQTVVQIQARNTNEFDSIVRLNSERIISSFLLGEKRRMNINLDKFHDKAIFTTLLKDLNLTVKIVPGFFIAKKSNNFIWLRYETREIGQGIIIYSYPYISDSTFTYNFLLGKRDSLLRHNVSGPTENSYMAIEKRVDSQFHIIEHNKNYAAEMRGLWRLEHDFMGGPYISLTELDASSQRIVEVLGYVYAPSKSKRDLVKQVETMIYTLKFEGQEKNDKINSQIKMGN